MKEETLQKKQAVVDEIKQQIEDSHSVTLVEFKGLSVADVTELRNKYREAGVDYKIYKNTMVRLALKDLGIEGFDDLLNGPNALAFSKQDMVNGPKVSYEFAKDHEDQFSIKAGLMDGKAMTAQEVEQLSKLPNKEVLLSMVLRALQGPIAGLANVAQGTLRSAVYALEAVRKKKEEEAA